MHETRAEPDLEMDPGREARSVRLLRVREVSTKTGLSRAYIYKLERQGEFPKRRKIAENCVGWLEHEVDDWCLSRPVVELAG